MASSEINHPSIKKCQAKLQKLFDKGVMKSISTNFLFCNACEHKIKIENSGDHCLNTHLGAKIHLFILRENDTHSPGILKESDDPDDNVHVQREKYKRNRILAKVPNLYKEWIDVKYADFAYKFYCKICHDFTMSDLKRDLEKHMILESHQRNLQEYFDKVKCGKGSISVNTFAARCIGTPKKSQQIKKEVTPHSAIPPESEDCKKVQTPKAPHVQRDPHSTEICKVANKDSIRIYYQNVQSIRGIGKQRQFNRQLAENYDVIVFIETWLTDTSSLEIFDVGFDIYRCDRSSENTYKMGYGGVLIAVSSKLYSDVVVIEGFNFLEYVCLKLLHNDHFIYFYCLYMPGELKKLIGPQHIKAIEAINCNKNDTLIVVGDFNMPGIEWKASANKRFFHPNKREPILQSLRKNHLFQLNNMENKYGNVLDLMFVNDTTAVKLSNVHGKHSLMPVIDVHPPFEILIDSLDFPCDLSADARLKAYSIRKDCIQKMEKLFKDLEWNNFEQNMEHLSLVIRLISKED